jgi:hypothetical protein
MSSFKENKTQDATRAGLLIAGLGKHPATVGSLTIGSVPYTPAELAALLQTLVDLRRAVTDAQAAAQTKLANERAQAPALRSLMSALVTILKTSFGNSPDILADFGLTPRKVPAPLTVDAKRAAAAKRKATRAARHTMGSKQRLAVKGAAPSS